MKLSSHLACVRRNCAEWPALMENHLQIDDRNYKREETIAYRPTCLMLLHVGPGKALQTFRGHDTSKTPWIFSLDLTQHMQPFMLAR